MVELGPGAAPTQAELAEWYNLQQQLKALREREHFLRMKIARCYFAEPAEGTNKHELDGGYQMKLTHKISRKVDLGSFSALRPELVEKGIRVDEVVQFKPELSVRAYRELTAEQMHLFDQCLIIKDGSPALEIVMPKARSK